MTAMPRALEVGAQVLDLLTPTLAENIERQGRALYDGFIALQHEFPTIIEGVDGTGLLIGVHLNEKTHPVNGRDGVEQYMRKAGINLIHGGKNALRYTPTFGITDAEVQLILDVLRFTLRNYA